MKARNVKITLLCLFLLLALMLPGCADTDQMYLLQKQLVWRKGDIQAEGLYKLPLGQRLYHRIFIGKPKKFAGKMPPIYIEFLAGEKILLSDITVDFLIDRSDIIKEDWGGMATGWKRYYWPKNTKFLEATSGGGYTFAIIDHELVGFLMDRWGPGFWNESLSKHYTFPLKEEELEELFGAPDEVLHFFTWH